MITNLFPLPLYTIQLDLDNDLLLKELSNSNWAHDWMLEKALSPNLSLLYTAKRLAAESVLSAMNIKDVDIISTNVCSVEYTPGTAIGFHHHPMSLISTVYYTEGVSGDLVLIDPRASTAIGRHGVRDQYCNTLAEYRITPRPGLLVAFPSSIVHGVTPTDEMRSIVNADWSDGSVFRALMPKLLNL